MHKAKARRVIIYNDPAGDIYTLINAFPNYNPGAKTSRRRAHSRLHLDIWGCLFYSVATMD